ncbi:MAG: hypothetical protein ACI9KD_003142, partial [Congregibacter sp.]
TRQSRAAAASFATPAEHKPEQHSGDLPAMA